MFETVMGTKYRSAITKESASKRLTMAYGIKNQTRFQVKNMLKNNRTLVRFEGFGVVLLMIQVFWNMYLYLFISQISNTGMYPMDVGIVNKLAL